MPDRDFYLKHPQFFGDLVFGWVIPCGGSAEFYRFGREWRSAHSDDEGRSLTLHLLDYPYQQLPPVADADENLLLEEICRVLSVHVDQSVPVWNCPHKELRRAARKAVRNAEEGYVDTVSVGEMVAMLRTVPS